MRFVKGYILISIILWYLVKNLAIALQKIVGNIVT